MADEEQTDLSLGTLPLSRDIHRARTRLCVPLGQSLCPSPHQNRQLIPFMGKEDIKIIFSDQLRMSSMSQPVHCLARPYHPLCTATVTSVTGGAAQDSR